jgi:hypothetical protein
MSMQAFEAGTLLTRLARGGDVELGPGEDLTLAELVRERLVARAPEVSAQVTELEGLRRELATLVAPGAARPADAAVREKALRARALELVEIVSRGEGAATVRGAGAGPYRAGGGHERYVVTYQARSLLSDLAPRLGRVGRMSLADFRAHMDLLRDVLHRRALRAQSLYALLRANPTAATTNVSDGAVRSVAVGLSVRNEPERELTATWGLLVQALTQADAADGTGASEWTPDQEAAAAEGMILATADLATLSHASARLVHTQRLDLLRRYSGAGFSEDALDATMLLSGSPTAPAALAEAAELATAAAGFGTPLPVSAALVLRASRSVDRAGLVAQLRARLAALSEGVDERERTYAAVLLALAGQDPAALLDRARDLRAYLSRFSPNGMLVPAALLALLPVDVAESLDLLRMTSAELQKLQTGQAKLPAGHDKHRFGAGGAELVTLSIKLLLATAMLAAGADGDREEHAGFVRFEGLSAQLGLAGLVSQVPLSFTALAAFHRPALDAALHYQEVFQPTHSPYVFGTGGRSRGWG